MSTIRASTPGLLLCASVLVSGCASSETLSGAAYDPWEATNRGVYAFNDGLDTVALRPIAKGYRKIVPKVIRRGVSNFDDNLNSPRSALNNFLQGKGRRGFGELGRFLINSTIGIGGLFDVANEFGIKQHEEDFGQTFAVWGMPDGPYVVVPFFGPSTLRDAISMPFDALSDPWYWLDNSSTRDKVYVLRAIDTRYRFLKAEEFIVDSKDPYITIRESYLQNRAFDIYDGNPPEDDDFYDEFIDEDEVVDDATQPD